jgi:hypothetical protein
MKLLMTVLVSLLLSATPAVSQDLTDLYRSSVSRTPYVVFAARAGAPGHAFVVLGEELDNGLLFNLGVYGFYPKDGKASVIKALFGTDGQITFKWEDLDRDVFFRRNIDAQQRGRVLAVLERWSDGNYSLLGNNCNSLAAEVGRVIGLTLPNDKPGTTLPVNFMKALKAANP